jgi:hypothetical protein
VADKEVSGCEVTDVIFKNFLGGSGKARKHRRIIDMPAGIQIGHLSNTSVKI